MTARTAVRVRERGRALDLPDVAARMMRLSQVGLV